MYREYIFVYKEKDSYNRDCVKYININDLKANNKDIVGKFNSHGACFSSNFREGDITYSEIKTILTEEEYKALCNPTMDMDFNTIINKLESSENQKLFEEVIQEEVKHLMEEYSLNEEDIEQIFEEYYLSYRDRAIVGSVFNSIDEASREEAEQLGYLKEGQERYFNYNTFGADMLESEQYLELDNGKIVYLMY